jgi:hypothetical protein
MRAAPKPRAASRATTSVADPGTIPESHYCENSMKLLDALVEQRIAVAVARGDFDGLSLPGRAVALDDDQLVPETVRVANRILKTAGFEPPAAEHLEALRHLPDEMQAVSERATRCQLQAKMLALDMALESLRGGPMLVPREYCRRIAERLSERVFANGADEARAS